MVSKVIQYSIISIFLMFYSCDDQGGPSYGCTDIDACNYNSDAELEDDTCEYPADDPQEIGDYCDCTGPITSNILDCNYACGGSSILDCDNNCNPSITYSVDVYPKIQTLNCLNCHTGTSNGGLNLSNYEGIMSLGTNSGGVIDTSCATYENSVILQKIDGGSMSANADQDLIDMLTIWISQGAQE